MCYLETTKLSGIPRKTMGRAHRSGVIWQPKTVIIVLMIGLVFGQLQAQSFIQSLAAPVFYEIGLQPGFQSNPLNLSDLEIEKAAGDPRYLDGINYSSSNVTSLYGKLNWSPRFYKGRKTRFRSQIFYHYYHDIQERSYQSFSFSVKQSLGNYRYLSGGYWILPKYYLRNYLIKDQATLRSTRQNCSFGTDRLWLGFEHRLSRKNRLEYRLNVRREIYQAPFAHYDMQLQELGLKLKIDQFKVAALVLDLQYGMAENDNQIDQRDRSYNYLNIRPTLTLTLTKKYRLRLAGRYDQRAYGSEQLDDPLHAGRYQEEFRLDLSFLPKMPNKLVLEPFAGYRERRVDSSDPLVRELKSFSRYWVGIRVGFRSVIDMYF